MTNTNKQQVEYKWAGYRFASPVWHSKQYGDMLIEDMNDPHLENAIAMIFEAVVKEREKIYNNRPDIFQVIAEWPMYDLARKLCPQFVSLCDERDRRLLLGDYLNTPETHKASNSGSALIWFEVDKEEGDADLPHPDEIDEFYLAGKELESEFKPEPVQPEPPQFVARPCCADGTMSSPCCSDQTIKEEFTEEHTDSCEHKALVARLIQLLDEELAKHGTTFDAWCESLVPKANAPVTSPVKAEPTQEAPTPEEENEQEYQEANVELCTLIIPNGWTEEHAESVFTKLEEHGINTLFDLEDCGFSTLFLIPTLLPTDLLLLAALEKGNNISPIGTDTDAVYQLAEYDEVSRSFLKNNKHLTNTVLSNMRRLETLISAGDTYYGDFLVEAAEVIKYVYRRVRDLNAQYLSDCEVAKSSRLHAIAHSRTQARIATLRKSGFAFSCDTGLFVYDTEIQQALKVAQGNA